MAGFDCAGGSGVGAAAFVVAGLAAAGYQNVYDVAASAAVCMEPIVVRQHEWSCEARLDDGSERGRERVRVYVCRCSVADCVKASAAVCGDLIEVYWPDVNAVMTSSGVRIVSVSVGASDDVGRDSCGRWVRAFDVECTVVRSNG